MWFRKKTVSLPILCREYYDDLLDSRSQWIEDAGRLLGHGDPSSYSFPTELVPEVIALRIELFSVAWLDRFERGQPVLAQSEFTKAYLAEKGRTNLWTAMGTYNGALSRAGIAGDDDSVDEQKRAELERRKSDMADRFARRGVGGEHIERVGNRLMARFVPGGKAVLLIASALIKQVNVEGREPLSIGSTIYGYYEHSRNSLRNVELKEYPAFRWF